MTWPQKIAEWLVEEKGENLTTIDGKPIKVFSFNYDSNDSETMSAWAKHFRNNYCQDEMIDIFRKGTQYSRKEFLEKLIFPSKTSRPGPSTCSGDFAEILICDYFEYVLKYWVPRTKYDNKQNNNTSSQGSDIIGFKFIQEVESPKDILAVIEAKAAFSNKQKGNRLEDAIKDSSKDINRLAISLHAIKRRLIEKGKLEESLKVERFQNPVDNPYIKKYGAAALFSIDSYDETKIQIINTSNHIDASNLILLVVKGKDMMNLVYELYRRAADEA